MAKLVLSLLFMLTASLAVQAVVRPYCVVCRRQVPQRYIKASDNRIYCSRKCFEKNLPRCSVCSAVYRQGVLRNDKGFYCSKKCFEKTLPKCDYCGLICRRGAFRTARGIFCSKKCTQAAHLPRCNRCGRPFQKGRELPTVYGKYYYCEPCSKLTSCLVCERPDKNMRLLTNKYYLCRSCDVNTVENIRQLQKLFDQVRRTLCEKLNFRNDHNIKLFMRSFGKNKQDRFDKSREFGLYKYSGTEITTKPLPFEFWRDQKTTVRYENESCSIVVMDCLPAVKAAEVIAHELAHDYMKHRWYYIKDNQLREGFAELVAAIYNQLTGNAKWNYRMELNPDKIYGDGYRRMKNIYQKSGWEGVCRYLDKANQQAYPYDK